MKLDMISLKAGAVAGVVTAILAGCSTPTIPITMNVSGEVKLNGVSKIAIADFNSLPGDPFTGTMAADEETCALVKQSVASAFYDSPMYQIVDMDIEKQIHDESDVLPGKRFDAVIYGRLWWQVTPETKGQYPCKFKLTTWEKYPYQSKDGSRATAEVITQTKDVLKMLEYRVRNATLMLTLSIYRLEKSGDIVKITDTYQVTNRGFTLMNGEMKLDCAGIGVKDDNAVTRLQQTGKDENTSTAYEDMFEPKAASVADVGAEVAGEAASLASGLKDFFSVSWLFGGKKDEPAATEGEPAKDEREVDANGKLILTQKTVSIPTELQAKLMLAESVSKSLSAKIAPSKTTFDVPADFGERRLENLLKNGAFSSAREYSLYMLRQKMGKQICEKLVDFLPDFAEQCSYPVPDTKMQIDWGEANCNEKMMSYLAGQDLDVYFYALGICNEAKQNMDEAMEYYRFAFNVNPSFDYALGLSRVYLAMGERARLKQTEKAKNKAAKKAKLD